MIHVVYVSAACELFSPAQLQALLVTSRANNTKLGITGMLLYKDGNFMQVIEGDEDVVTTLNEHISHDPRHRGMVTMLKEPITTRQFAEWSMGFGDLNDPAVAKLPGYSDFLQTPLTEEGFKGDKSRSLRMLKLFKRTM